jgi:hypothetical protein
LLFAQEEFDEPFAPYGDSITQPEGYFPTADFPLSWTQRIIGRLNGNAVSSGRGGQKMFERTLVDLPELYE